VLVGGCLEVGDVGLPYVPVITALHSIASETGTDELLPARAKGLPGLGRLLPDLAEEPVMPTVGGELEQLQLFDAVRALLVRLSERAPVVLMLEDLHWADPSTRELVAFLHQTLQTGRVLLVGSYRSDELHRRHPLRPLLAELVRLPQVERLQLAPFSRAELAEHLEAITGAPLAAEQLERIFARSEGNPFYAEQLLATGAEDAQVALPETLADLLLARVQALVEPAQQMLRVAAVAGRRVHHLMLTQVTGWLEADLEQALREAIGAGLLMADSATGTYAFRHALLREAVYADLLPGEQVRLHAAYAELLAADPQGVAAELAYHCLQSHDLVGALRASLAAAGEAEAVLAPTETLRHLSTALKLWGRVSDPAMVAGTNRVELTLAAAKAASAAGDHQRALAFAQDAATIVDATADPAQAARVYERLGQYLGQAYRLQDALRAQARAVELVPTDRPTPLRARVTAAMAQALMHTGRRDQARRWCDQALTAARGAGSADDEALITLGVIEAYDDPASARPRFAAARARAAEVGNREIELRALHDLAWVESLLGNLPAARAVSDEGAELAQQSGLAWSPLGMAFAEGSAPCATSPGPGTNASDWPQPVPSW